MRAFVILRRLRRPIPQVLGAALLVLCLGLPGAAQAQTGPGAEDLRALIFYVNAADTAAIEAELRRLRSQFPGWAPPADLSDLTRTTSGPELDPIYRRIAANDIAGARRAIAEAQAGFPAWTPSADMMRLILIAEAQGSFDAAIGARDLAAAVGLTRANPDLLRCDRVNNAWLLAELQAGAGNRAAAFASYRAVVSACTGFADVVASIEKARAVADDAALQSLISTARSRFAGSGAALDALEARLLGRVPGSAPAAAAAAAGATAPRPKPAAAAAAVPAVPAASPLPAVAQSTGALTAPLASGSVQRGLSRLSRLPRNGDGRLSSVRAAAQSGAFVDCVARSTNPGSLDVAYERAWCVYNLDRPLEALALFAAAAEAGLGGTVGRDARFGMALAYTKRNMTEEASRIAASTDFTPEQRRDIEAIILDQRGVRAYQQKDFRRAIAFFDALDGLTGSLRRDLAILRAYSFLEVGERRTAFEQFEALHRELATAETRAGMSASR